MGGRGPQPEPVAMTETLTWHPIPGPDMPDDDCTVLLYSPTASEPVWPGYHCADEWIWANGIPARSMTAWAHMPEGPKP